MSDKKMTREEFDVALNAETVNGLLAAKANLRALQGLAKGFQRPDIAAVFDPLIQAHDVAIATAEQLGRGVISEETLS